MTMLLWIKCQVARGGITLCRCNTPTELEDSSNRETDSGLFTVRAATRPTAMDRAAQQSGVRASSVKVRLGNGVGPSFVMRPQCPCAPPPILHPTSAFMLGGEWVHS